MWEAAGASGEPRDAVVTLEKKIPMQAGLGGGSSDAAAALLGLGGSGSCACPTRSSHAIAAKLGSDVPYFLVGGTALGLGRGEEVYPLEDLPRIWVVLVSRRLASPPKDAYAWLDEAQKGVGACSASRRHRSRPLFRTCRSMQ